MATATKRHGRRRRGHNRGYWFRAGRGWMVTVDGQPEPLLDENGKRLKEREQEEEGKKAYARWLLDREREEARRRAIQSTVAEVCRCYLDYAEGNNRPATYDKRADYLYDLCTGYPAAFRDRGNGKRPRKPKAKDRIHPGYGNLNVADFTPLHVDRWLVAHKGWRAEGTKKSAIQGLKRAFNYAVSRKLIPENPIRGYKVGRSRKRITYFTPEVEERLYQHANKALALAIKVCIRTGARYGCEFCALTAEHVEETPRGQLWRFPPEEAKTSRERVIFVAPEIAEIVRELIKKHGPGVPLFRNTLHRPCTQAGLKKAFERVKKKLKEIGQPLAADDCMYSCRHTFAKRTLGGYWTGRKATIEQLAGLMGNTRQICWEHYARWCEAYTDPLWEAVV